MQDKEKLTQIKNGLPFGGLKELSERTGLTRITIYNIFKGKKANMKNVIKVIQAGEKIISEYSEIMGEKPRKQS